MNFRLYALIVKEFHAIWRDRKSRMVLILPPIVQIILFGLAATLEVTNVQIAVLNRDQGELGRDFAERLRGSPVFPRINYLASEAEIRQAIDNREDLLVVSIPNDFSRDIRAGHPGNLQVILDGRRVNSAQIATGYITTILNQWESDTFGSDKIAPGAAVSRTWFNSNRIYRWFTVPGLLGVLMALQAMLLTGLSVARERELGTFDQVLVSPLTPGQIILGKTIPSLIIGLSVGTVVLIFAVFFFRIPFRGFVPLLYLGMSIYLLAMIGVGLFMSSLAQTQQQALLGTFVVMMPIILLSGFMTPVENMPVWLQHATVWNPLRYFLIIVKGVFLKDMTFKMVLINAWPLGVIAAFTLCFSTLLFRKRLG